MSNSTQRLSHVFGRHFLRNFVPGEWTQVRDDLVRTFDADGGLILSLMVNLDWLDAGCGEHDADKAKKRQRRYLRKRGWVALSRKLVEAKYGWNSFRQARILGKLMKVQAIQVKMMGNPAKRHFLLNEEVIENLVVNKNAQDSRSATPGVAKPLRLFLRGEVSRHIKVPDAAGVRVAKETDMPLDGVNLPANAKGETIADNKDRHRAQLLKTALTAKRIGLARGWSKSAWAKEFAALVQVFGVEEVDSLLTWYCNNIGGRFVPKAYSAKSFREKWDDITAARKRDERDNPNVVVTEAARYAATHCEHLIWPKGTDKDLLLALQLTINSFSDLVDRIGKVAQRPEQIIVDAKKRHYKYDHLVLLARAILGTIPPARAYAEQWVRELHKLAVYYGPAWKGSVLKAAPRTWDDKSLVDLVNGASQKYGSDQSVIDQLWKEIAE